VTSRRRDLDIRPPPADKRRRRRLDVQGREAGTDVEQLERQYDPYRGWRFALHHVTGTAGCGCTILRMQRRLPTWKAASAIGTAPLRWTAKIALPEGNANLHATSSVLDIWTLPAPR